MSNLLKIPPHYPELEKSVLGIILDQWTVLDDILDIIPGPNVFYNPSHQIIFTTILHFYRLGYPADLISVTNELRKMEQLDAVGGAHYLTELTRSVTSLQPLKRHCIEIREASMRREQINIAAILQQRAFDLTNDIWETFEEIDQKLFNLQQITTSKDIIAYEDAIGAVIKNIDEYKKSGNSLTGIDTGFRMVNAHTSGWQKTDLIIIAARPSVGKTAFALSLAYNASKSSMNPNKAGAVFSMEMGTLQIVKRMLAAIEQIPLSDINQPTQLADIHYRKISEARKVSKKLGVYIDDTPALSIPLLRSKIRRLVKKQNIQWVILDYLQLMTGAKNKNGNREQEISQISRDLKAIAKEFEIPIIALSQLNRIEADEEPSLTNIRESGAIEQDADIIMFLWNASKTLIKEDSANENKKFISCAKNRNGETFSDVLEFDKTMQLFSDVNSVFQEQVYDNPRKGISPNYIPDQIAESPF